jgi:rubrerythrin
MDVLGYAMNLEKEGEEYYRELAESCENEGVKKILIWLAEEEVKHYNIFKAMKTSVPQMEQADILDRAESVFRQMKKEGSFEPIPPLQINAYRKALELEKKTYDYYMEQSQHAMNQEQKEIFLKVAGEEDQHYRLVESIIEFISAPERYLDYAEFYHIDTY